MLRKILALFQSPPTNNCKEAEVQEWLNDLAESLKYLEHSKESIVIIEELIEQAKLSGYDISALREILFNRDDDGRFSLFSDEYTFKGEH